MTPTRITPPVLLSKCMPNAGLVVLPHVASKKRRSGASDGAGWANHHPAQRNVVDLTAALLLPANDNDPGKHLLTVAELIGGPQDIGWLANARFVLLQQIGYLIGDGLGVGGASAAATVDLVGEAGKFVGDAVDYEASRAFYPQPLNWKFWKHKRMDSHLVPNSNGTTIIAAEFNEGVVLRAVDLVSKVG